MNIILEAALAWQKRADEGEITDAWMYADYMADMILRFVWQQRRRTVEALGAWGVCKCVHWDGVRCVVCKGACGCHDFGGNR